MRPFKNLKIKATELCFFNVDRSCHFSLLYSCHAWLPRVVVTYKADRLHNYKVQK